MDEHFEEKSQTPIQYSKMEIEDIKLELGDEIKEALFEVVEELLQTDKFKVRVEHGSKKGIFFIWKIILQRSKSEQLRKNPLQIEQETILLELFIE